MYRVWLESVATGELAEMKLLRLLNCRKSNVATNYTCVKVERNKIYISRVTKWEQAFIYTPPGGVCTPTFEVKHPSVKRGNTTGVCVGVEQEEKAFSGVFTYLVQWLN
jgi:hypothetical protein